MALNSGADPYQLAPDAPADLQRAAETLRAAHYECVSLIYQWELWKVLTTDEKLLTRLSFSKAAQAVVTMQHALLSAIVLGISRMVDDSSGKEGKKPLNVKSAFNPIFKHASWLRDTRVKNFATLPVILCDDQEQGKAGSTDLERMIQEGSARRAATAFDEHLAAFRTARRRFTKGEAGAALERLQEFRNKEVGHNELDAVWKGERPKVDDLDLVFHTMRDLLYSAIFLCTGSYIDVLRGVQIAWQEALCLGATLRAETTEERARALARAKDVPG